MVAAVTISDLGLTSEVRDAVADHADEAMLLEQLTALLTPGSLADRLESALSDLGCIQYYYSADELDALALKGLVDAPPIESVGGLIAGRAVGRPGFGQPFIQLVVYLRPGNTVLTHRLRTLHAG